MRERLLTLTFLKRFLENDLISPDADRHEILAVLCAALTASSLFVTVLFAWRYQLEPFMSAGRTSLVALDDRFFYISCSMVVMALVAVAVWDALSLDARDASILGPLPIPHGAIVRTKLTAVVLLAAGIAVVLNLAPTVMRPWMVPVRLRIGLLEAATLTAAHAAATLTAGAFGFAAVLGLRETLHAVLGPGRFSRVSTIVQAFLVVALATMFLLLPGVSSNVARSWLAGEPLTPYALPPVWFVGLHEMLAGHVIARRPGEPLPPRLVAAENDAMELYRSYAPLFQDLAGLAVAALVGALLLAVAAYAWNSRRLPAPLMARRNGRRPLSAIRLWVVQRLIAPHPVARAAFFFTLQSLSRSVPHRLSIATAFAVGLAVATVTLRGVDIRGSVDVSSISLALLAVQTVLVTAMLAGVRHAVRVPAELRANWVFHLAWSGDERPYLSGVKRAVFMGLVVPALLAFFPAHAFGLGGRVALLHLFGGLAIALLAIETLMLGYRKLPFASSYVPSGNVKSWGPICAVVFWAVAWGLAWLERLALSTNRGSILFLAGLVGLVFSLRVMDSWQRRTRTVIELNEPIAPATQRLDLIR